MPNRNIPNTPNLRQGPYRTIDRSYRWLLLLPVWFMIAAWPGLESLAAPPATPLVWHTKEDRVDARIQNWNLNRFLEHLASITGWRVYIEPDTEKTVTATFIGLRTGDALRRLLGNLNFALLPQTNGPAKFFVFRTSVHEATQLIESPPPQKAKLQPQDNGLLANELLVTLKPGSASSIQRLARELGAKIIGQAEGLNAYRLQFEDAESAESARKVLDTNSDVAATDSNYLLGPPTRTDALALSSGLSLNLKPSNSGDKTIVGLIDTAVQSQGSQLEGFLMPALSVASSSELPNNRPTHGTSMAETILRGLTQTPEAAAETSVRILPVDVYGGAAENTTTFEVAKGIAAAVQAGATVVNLSLGGEGNSDFLHQVIQEAHQQGVVFFAGAGNDPSGVPYYPAAYPEVVAVTAGDKRGNIASYANRGTFVDVIAPGTSLVQFNETVYMVTGTSTATAYVSGVAASLAANKNKTTAEIESQIRSAFASKDSARPSP